ncbi:hypothetical protein RBU60_03200 [Mesonia sp. MT50]|uniref:Uncharacterized protein n=1 Tax=Mesonia profundi TaxID=3070998 RepID=A0ABU1A112_9FLAO|nr:hypothetical protein [Mesonia profundi]MDQ7916569.1 hypothetical protein [Mesonia profundi]
MTMNKLSFLQFLKFLLSFSLVLCFLQYFLVEEFLQQEVYYSTFMVYGFLFTVTLGIYAVLLFIHKNFKDKTGFAFMGLSLFKMFLSVLFLLPVILAKEDQGNLLLDIFAFFIPYFLYLLFETVFAVRLLQDK